MSLLMKKLQQSKNNMIGILPFISFKNPPMEFEDFIIFSDFKIDDIKTLPNDLKKSLKAYSQNQKNFYETTFQNSNGQISYIISGNNSNKEILNDFLETLFFYLHKGKITNFFSIPNGLCKEDFKYIILEFYGDKSNGQFIAKKKFKFQIKNKFEDFIIHPIGCENISSPELEKYNYKYREIELNTDDFLNFWNNIKNQENTQRAISFYNKAMSCELMDDERFVWLSSSLESFFAIGKDNDKSKKIKDGVCNLVCNKNFQVLNKCEVIERLSNLITVVYDYRSSYVHGGKRTTNSNELEKQLAKCFGKIDFVVALMNLVSVLLVHKQIEDNKFESIMNIIFYNQDVFNETIKIFEKSADNAKTKLNDSQAIITMERFFIADPQFIKFKSSQIEKCLNNILCILAKFAKKNNKDALAIKIQKEINKIGKDDPEKYKKWNDFLSEINSSNELTIEIYYSILVFRRLFELLKYEFTLY